MSLKYRASARGYSIVENGRVILKVQRIPESEPLTITAIQIGLQRNAERAMRKIAELSAQRSNTLAANKPRDRIAAVTMGTGGHNRVNVQQMFRLIKDGYSLREVAARTGLSAEGVRYQIKKELGEDALTNLSGYSKRTHGMQTKPGHPVNEEAREKIRAATKQGQTRKQIARALRMTPQGVDKHRRALRVPLLKSRPAPVVDDDGKVWDVAALEPGISGTRQCVRCQKDRRFPEQFYSKANAVCTVCYKVSPAAKSRAIRKRRT
jgi:DNA-binding CsgD family transcriptional regulator